MADPSAVCVIIIGFEIVLNGGVMGHLNLLTLELFLSDKVKYYEQLNLILKLFLR